MKLITYLIVYKNTFDITSRTIRAIEKFSSIPFNILLINNGSNNDKMMVKYGKILNVIKPPFNAPPQMIHGMSIDFAMKFVKTKYCCVVDSDASFLCNGFDKMLIANLSGNYKLISTHERTYKDKKIYTNHADLMFFKTNTVKNMGIKFAVNHAMGIDTGGCFGLELNKRGYKVRYLNKAKKRIEGLSRQYKLDGVLIFSHMGRGTNKAVAASKGGYKKRKNDWIKAMDKILNESL